MAKKKRGTFSTSAYARLLEIGLIAVVIAMGVFIATLHKEPSVEAAAEPVESVMIPTETELFSALQNAGFAPKNDALQLSDGRTWAYALKKDALGVTLFSVTLPLAADAEDDGSLFYREYNRQNAELRERLKDLLAAVCPLFGGTPDDGETILQKCVAAQSKMQNAACDLPYASVRIQPETTQITVRFSRRIPVE